MDSSGAVEMTAESDLVVANHVRQMRVIIFALCFGVVLYAGLVVFVLPSVWKNAGASIFDVRTSQMVTAVVLGLTCIGWIMGFGMSRQIRGAIPATDPTEAALGRFRAARIVQAGIGDGCCLIGLVALTLAEANGGVAGRPWVWLELVPLALFLAHSALTWPTVDRMQRLLQARR